MGWRRLDINDDAMSCIDEVTFAFYIGDRFYGVVTAFVPGAKAANYDFTSALPVQILKELQPVLQPLISGVDAIPGRCAGIGRSGG